MNYELRIMRKRIFVDLKAGFRLRVINQKFLLILLLLPLISCGKLGARRELERNQFFVEILKHEDRRSFGEDGFFENNLVANPDSQVRQWSAIALARIADPRSLPLLYRALHSGDTDARAASAFAIGEIEDSELLRAQYRNFNAEAATELRHLLDDPSLAVQMRAMEALGKIGSYPEAADIVRKLERFSYRGQPLEQAYLSYGITALARLKDPVASTVLERLAAINDPEIQWRALDALARLQIKTAAPLFEGNLENPNPLVRAYAAHGLGMLADPNLAFRLLPLLPPHHAQTAKPNPLPVRISALQALGELKNPSVIAPIKAALEAEPIDAAHPDQLNFAMEAAAVLGAIGTAEGEAVVLPLLQSRRPLANNALLALAKILKGNAPRFFGLVDGTRFSGPDGTAAWTQAMVALGGGDAVKELKRMLVEALEHPTSAEKENFPAILTALAKLQPPRRQDILAPFFASQDADVLRAVVEAYQPGTDAKTPWMPIIQAWNASSSGGNTETRITILSCLKPWTREPQVQQLLRSGFSDPERDVRIACASLLRKAGVTDISQDPGPASSSISDAFCYAIAAIRKRSTIAILDTDRGVIEIELFRQDAPLTTASFIMAANRGIYNGLEFELVIPGQRIEGEVHKTETAFRRAVKSEVHMRPFEQGSLAMALKGGSSDPGRIFITLSPQPYLDGTYTCFGRVLSGMQVAERLAPGDRIKHISIKETISFLDYYKY
jgi:peptidyl-prolyl cis-trans isomerase B (cyclophilin B)